MATSEMDYMNIRGARVFTGSTFAELKTLLHTLTDIEFLSSKLLITSSGNNNGSFVMIPMRLNKTSNYRSYECMIGNGMSANIHYEFICTYYYNGNIPSGQSEVYNEYTKVNNGNITSVSPTISAWTLYIL